MKDGPESCFVTWWTEKEEYNYVYKPCPGESSEDDGKIEVQIAGELK